MGVDCSSLVRAVVMLAVEALVESPFALVEKLLNAAAAGLAD